MAGQLQFVFGNPTRKKRKGASVKRKTTRKRKNPQYYLYKKGKTLKRGTVFPKTSELNSLRTLKEAAGKNISKIETKVSELATAGKGRKKPASSAKIVRELRGLQRDLTKAKLNYSKQLANFKKASKEKKDLAGKGYKAKLKDIKSEDKQITSKLGRGLKKVDAEIKKAKKKKGGSVAKKKAKKKVTRKKATKKKVAKKKKVTKKKGKKKVARKKAPKKKATKKKARKKVAKKKTKKKAAKRKGTGKKKTKRRKKRAIGVGAFKKSLTRSMSKKKGVRKGKKKTWKVKKGKKRYSATIARSKRNPFFGGNMKLKKYLKHDGMEAAGLFLGGAASLGVNDVVTRFLPATVIDSLQKVLGNFSGAVFPIAAGIAAGMANKKVKSSYLESLAKGLIGAGVVGMGATAYSSVTGGLSTMSGKLAHDYASLEGDYNQMGGDYNQMGGDYNQMGAVVSDSFDESQPEVDPSEDFGGDDPYTIGAEYQNFEGMN